MNAESIFKFKTLFEEQRRKLVYSHGIVNEEFHLQKDDLLDEADMTTSELEQGMRMRLRSREALFIKKVDEALRRIAEGTVGECESCGDDIDPRRLEARPTTSMCVGCKEEQERLELVHIDGHRPKSLGNKLRLA
jgi:DnaK suppressor protein